MHGLKNERGRLSVDIKCVRIGNDAQITINDDGCGIEKKHLERNLYSIRNRIKTSSIGLSNVNERLELIFGENYGLELKSEEGRYTTAILTYPIKYTA